MEIKWKDVEALPIDEPQTKKVLLLAKGRSSSNNTLYIVSDYWNVSRNGSEFDLRTFQKNKTFEDGSVLYGRFVDDKVPIEKIKAWMFADDLIELYNDGQEDKNA